MENLSGTEYELVINKEYEPWYPIFEQLYSNDFTFHPHCITFNLNKEIFIPYNISMTQVKDALEDKLDDILSYFPHYITLKLTYSLILTQYIIWGSK